GPQRRGAANVEHVRHAGPYVGLRDSLRDRRRQVVHVAVALGLNGELFLENHDWQGYPSATPDFRRLQGFRSLDSGSPYLSPSGCTTADSRTAPSAPVV